MSKRRAAGSFPRISQSTQTWDNVLFREQSGHDHQLRLYFFSRNARPTGKQPKKIAYHAIVQINASAPAPGQASMTTPKTIDSRPLMMSHHSFSTTLRN